MRHTLLLQAARPIAAVLLSAILTGCGGSPNAAALEPVVPASGVATYKGEPLEHFTVIVYPEGKRPAQGLTDKDGKFVLNTNGDNDGAAVGTHKVSLSFSGPPIPPDVDPATLPPAKSKVKLPAKYMDPQKSGLTVTIPEGGAADLKLELN